MPLQILNIARSAAITFALLAASAVATSSANAQSSITTLYSWSATNIDGVVKMTGALPSEENRKFLGFLAGNLADDTTTITDNPPQDFAANAAAAMQALSQMDRGRVAFTGAKWSVAGSVSDEATLDELFKKLEENTDTSDWIFSIDVGESGDSFVAELSETRTPASETDDDQAELSDPNTTVDENSTDIAAETSDTPEAAIATQQGEATSDTSPSDENSASQESKTAEATTEEVPAAEAEAEIELAQSTDEEDSAQETQENEPVQEVAPTRRAGPLFNWAVRKSIDGTYVQSGLVPVAAMEKNFARSLGIESEPTLEVGTNAPIGFVQDAYAAIAALKLLDEGRIAYTGAKWSIAGTAPSKATKEKILSDLERFVDVEDWFSLIDLYPFTFQASITLGDQVTFSGKVPAEQTISYLETISKGDVSALSVADNPPPDFVKLAVEGTYALLKLESGTFSYADDVWQLSGESVNQDISEPVITGFAAASDVTEVQVDIKSISGFDFCARQVANFSNEQAILFAPGSARLQDESATALETLADELKNCPQAFLHVEGHTDSDGPEQDNLLLSLARAEAVVTNLTTLGVDFRQIYAIGYGESLPIADNDTRAGKAQNRRIVFKLERE